MKLILSIVLALSTVSAFATDLTCKVINYDRDFERVELAGEVTMDPQTLMGSVELGGLGKTSFSASAMNKTISLYAKINGVTVSVAGVGSASLDVYSERGPLAFVCELR